MSAVTQNEYTQNDNTTVLRNFTFPYLKTSDIKVSLDGVATTAFTLPNATTIQLNSVPPNGTKIRIFRETGIDDLTATFYAGSAIKSEDLNDNFTQNLFVTQEVNQRFINTLGGSMVGDLNMGEDAEIIFEGATDNDNETKLSVVDPTADQTYRLPNLSAGTYDLVSTGDTGTVSTTMIAGDAVNGTKIADDSIDSEHYVDGSIDEQHIANLQVTNAKLGADAVTGAKIADDSINSEHYVDLSIDTQHIADAQITNVKIADTAVNTVKIANNSIISTKIADDAVITAKIPDNAITQAKMADDSVGTNELVDGSVGVDALATNAVTNAKVADDAIGTSELVNDAVTTVKIADNAVTMAKLSSGTLPTDISIASANIPDSTILTTDIADDAVTVGKIADAELKTLAGMQSGTASKLADSTALTADIADLNQIDGLTKQTTISDSDASFPTSGAVVDYVAAQLAPLGGFEAIANEQSFPNTQPAAGVVISIADAGGLAVSSSGTASGQTVGGTTVNITGIASNFNSTTVSNGVRFLVASTGSGQNYTYHKATLNEDDLVSLSGDINDFAERYRVGSSNPTTNLDNGDLFFNTGTGKMLVYNGTNTAWEEVQSIGNFFISTLSPAFDGTTQNFTITNAPTNAEQVLLVINGVVQKPNAGTSTPSEGFALDGSTVKLGAAPATGDTYHAVVIGSTVNIGTPSNNTVTSAILQNGSVITTKIADDAVNADKLASNAVVNDSVDASAAIAGTKISPDFGSQNIVTTGHVDLPSDSKLVLGDNDEFEISHNSSNGNAIIRETGSGNLSLQTNGNSINFYDSTNDRTMATFQTGGQQLFKYAGSTRLRTTSTGIDITGTCAVDGNITVTGTVDGKNVSNLIQHIHQDTTPQLGGNLDTNSNSISLGDSNNDAAATGTVNRLKFGAGPDMVMYHNGTDNFLKNPNGTFKLFTGADKQSILAVPDAEVSLHYNDGKKLETTNTGVTVTGTCTATAFSGDGSALTGITSFVTGMILLWSGAANAIPTGWVLCDGNNSTPNLTDRFVVGAGNSYSVGDNGGSNTATDTVSISGSDTVNITVSGNTGQPSATGNAGFPLSYSFGSGTHTHSFSGSGSDTVNISGSDTVSIDTRSPYYALCYIMKT